jgi:hypothetical protein
LGIHGKHLRAQARSRFIISNVCPTIMSPRDDAIIVDSVMVGLTGRITIPENRFRGWRSKTTPHRDRGAGWRRRHLLRTHCSDGLWARMTGRSKRRPSGAAATADLPQDLWRRNVFVDAIRLPASWQ